MKRILLFLLLTLSVSAVEVSSFVNDEADILSAEDEVLISGRLRQLFDSGVAEFAVVTIKSLDGKNIESVAFDLAEGNLGQEGKNNGLLLLVAVDDRQYRFEVGRGLEPVLPDVLAGRIGRAHLEPFFKEGNYSQGINEVVIAVGKVLSGEVPASSYAPVVQPNFVSLGVFFLFVIVIIIISIFSRKGRHSDSDYLFAAYMLSQLLRGGKGSGGFGGFGGGSFGGGGMSGRFSYVKEKI